MIATFVLFLREGLEACLIVSILLAALRQLGQPQQMRAVWTGAILAAVGALAGGVAIYFTVRAYEDTTFEIVFETITYLLAVIILTGMTFWMQKHSRTLKSELVTKASTAGSGFAFGLLAFTSVGREGLETAVFTVAVAFQTNGILLILGGLLGILAAVGLCVAIYRLGYHLDYRLFFRVMGVLLLIFAAGLLVNAAHSLQELGWLTFGSTPLWSTAHLLSQESEIGHLLHGLFGYTDSPTALQATLYVLYLAIAGAIFVRMTRKPILPGVSGSTPATTTAATPGAAQSA
ncbi:MAG TPA: FTR1 family protein [Ktedonobacterales bacterium]